ncbi:MAG: ISAzo13 family transposase [Deltaproteobacteria bacterium]|nr:ISAzo13 family transposase [Deltaproteobacteria bacterium]
MDREQIKSLWNGLKNNLNEAQKRRYAALLATTYGYGGAAVVHETTGVSLNTITAGKKELKNEEILETGRIRKKGGGPKTASQRYPNIAECVKTIVDGSAYGSPEKALSWTTESFRSMQIKLAEQYGLNTSHATVGVILEGLGYSKRSNQNMSPAGKPHPDRDAQFQFINDKAEEFLSKGEPVISAEAKKKENIENFKNPGPECWKNKDPRKALDHDFPLKELGKIAPYGVYNINDNIGFVNVGASRDTPEFAVENIARWCDVVGKNTFPSATKLMIACDGGGSDERAKRVWKYQLARLAKLLNIEIHVSHFPRGASKWNKVEHRLFCYSAKNWRGKRLIDVESAIDLIGSTTTTTVLKVICLRDDSAYELAKKVSDDEFNSMNIVKINPFDDWNYYFKPS